MDIQPTSQSIPVVIMCGGKGTRFKEETEFRPKPMVEIGGRPILWHIMKIYAHYGYKNFILCLGYKGTYIKDYFLNHRLYTQDFHLDLTKNTPSIISTEGSDDFSITFVDTGEDTLTAERLLRAEKYIPGNEFMLTYGDGVSDVDLHKLHTYHQQRRSVLGTVGTITGVHPKSKYGLVVTNEYGVITHFQEKPQLTDYTNGGFMVLTRDFLPYCFAGEMIEESLIKATQDRKIALYSHSGFWHCMDTFKDKEDLEHLWNTNPCWKIWDNR